MRSTIVVLLAALVASLASSCNSAPPEFSVDRVVAHVHKQCSFGPRTPGSAARDSVAAYATQHLARLGAIVRYQSFTVQDPYDATSSLSIKNVVAQFAPDRRTRLLLCAHYDSRPWADEDPDSSNVNQPILGAIDGATGTGVLLEVATMLAQKMPAGFGVDVVLFDGEDYGKKGDLDNYLIGSRYYAGSMSTPRPTAGILLDMVGGKGVVMSKEGYSRTHASEWTAEVFNRALGLELASFMNAEGSPIYDDHVPLLQAGLPMINLFGYNYDKWHTVEDTPEQISRPHLEDLGKLLSSILYDPPPSLR